MISRNMPTVLKFIALPDLQHSGRLVQLARKMPMRLAALEERIIALEERIALREAALRLPPIAMQMPLAGEVEAPGSGIADENSRRRSQLPSPCPLLRYRHMKFCRSS